MDEQPLFSEEAEKQEMQSRLEALKRRVLVLERGEEEPDEHDQP